MSAYIHTKGRPFVAVSHLSHFIPTHPVFLSFISTSLLTNSTLNFCYIGLLCHYIPCSQPQPWVLHIKHIPLYAIDLLRQRPPGTAAWPCKT